MLRAAPAVLSAAAGDGPPIILLNGCGARCRFWPHDIAGLGRRVIHIDGRRTGESRMRTAAFTFADLADDAQSAMLGHRTASVSVVGWSPDGMVAQELALHHPKMVDELVLVGTVPPAPTQLPVQRSSFALARVVLRRSSERWRRVVGELGGAGGAHESPERMRVIAAAFRENPIAWGVSMLQGLTARAWRDPEQLRAVAVPPTIIRGADNPSVPVENANVRARLIPHVRFRLLEGVGHLLSFEATDAFLDALMKEPFDG